VIEEKKHFIFQEKAPDFSTYFWEPVKKEDVFVSEEYIILKPGEILKPGDEYFILQGWKETQNIGFEIGNGAATCLVYRRRKPENYIES